jgi:lactate racemase
MAAGIPLARKICQVQVNGVYDLVIASPGGYPKDLNLYQAQKGLAHARLVTRPGGVLILAAACPEGTGSRSYLEWMQGIHSYQDVFDRIQREGFRVGPHKAFQIARDASQVCLQFYSEMPPELASDLLLNPIKDFQAAISAAAAALPLEGRIAVMPRAASTIPYTT